MLNIIILITADVNLSLPILRNDDNKRFSTVEAETSTGAVYNRKQGELSTDQSTFILACSPAN
jgi:hypothetical protein